jgi:hypothetical protein
LPRGQVTPLLLRQRLYASVDFLSVSGSLSTHAVSVSTTA